MDLSKGRLPRSQIRLKKVCGANTLAYHGIVLTTLKKSFVTNVPVDHRSDIEGIKLFFFFNDEKAK